jgi:DNA (cytosine-5)-methyltransferase 1
VPELRVQVVKPPYRVPTMAEVANVPWNGMRVASLFSGGGGSSLGYRMAGFEVVLATEFVAAARATYGRNFPDTTIDARDVREVTAESFMKAAGVKVGELDVLDGSPPCAGFSELVRKNTEVGANWGKENVYSDTKQRTDDLFFEYCRIVDGVQPRAFVAENVESLVEGKARKYFDAIMGQLKKSGYRVRARVLDAQWLGVPQMRKRLFLVGYREDLGIDPEHPEPLPYSYTLREALEGLPSDPEAEAACSFVGFAIEPVWRLLTRGTHRSDKYFGLWRASWDRPANAVTASTGKIGGASLSHPDNPRKFTAAELRRICSFPDDFALEGTYQQQVERLGRAVPPLVMRAVARRVASQLSLAASSRV